MITGTVGSMLRKLLVLCGIAAAVAALRLVVFQPSGNKAAAPAADGIAISAELQSAARDAIPAIQAFRPVVAGIFDALDGSGTVVAHVIDTTDMPDTLIGYAGKVPVAIILSPDGTTAAIRVLPNSETPSYLGHVIHEGLLNRFTGLAPEQALSAKVDAVSGATMSSEAILSSIKTGMAAVRGVSFGRQAPPHGEIAARIGAIAVLIAGLAFIFAPRRLRRFRPLLLIADVAVLGIIGGTTLSLAQFASWIANGPTIPRGVVPFLAFIVGAGIPLVTGRQAWCNCMCPFGAASELVSMIPVRKICLRPAARKALRLGGLVYLSVVIGLLVVWPDLDLASFEPFAAFSLAAAPIASIVIFAAFFVLSAFCPRLWCRFLCPTGRILDAFAWAGRRRASRPAPAENPDISGMPDADCGPGRDL